MALQYRRGAASISEAATRKTGNGNFRPFIPQIAWRKDGEQHYVLVLTDIEEVAELLLHSFIPVGKGTKSNGEEYTRYEEFLSRKMEAIGENYDDLEDRLEREPKVRHMGVMVELEPETENKKIVGFTVKTDTITRKTDDGEVEVEVPAIGLCTQSAQLMWGPLNNYFQQLGDSADVPLSITKNGEKTNTRYDFIPFMDRPVDLTPLIENLDGIGYVQADAEDVQHLVDAEDTDLEKARAIATYILVKRIDELADKKRYDDLVGPLELDDMPKNNWGAKKAPAKGKERAARPERRSPREPREESEAPAPSKNDRFSALKSRVENRA